MPLLSMFARFSAQPWLLPLKSGYSCFVFLVKLDASTLVKLILRLLGQHIHDNRFLKLVKDMLDAGYMEDWRYHQTHSGVPQGGVVSPILSNLVLNELDKWIEDNLILQHSRGQQRKRSAEYARLIKRRSDAKRQGQWKRYTQLGKELRRLPSKDPYDPEFRRLRFVRFADDFLLGYVGSKPEAEVIKEQISDFLAGLGLALSQEKTLITHARSKKGCFCISPRKGALSP